MSAKTQHDCWTVLARVMLHTGHDPPAITKNDLFAFRSAQLLQPGGAAGCHQVWELLTDAGILRPTTACTKSLRLGQRSVAHLVDRYDITPDRSATSSCATWQERKTSVDYTTLSGLAAGTSSATSGPTSKSTTPASTPLALPADVITAWKERPATVVGVNGETGHAPAAATSCSTSARSASTCATGPTKTPPSSPTRCPPGHPRRRGPDSTDANCTCGPRSTNESENASPSCRDRRPSRTRTRQACALREAAAKAPLDDLLTVDGRSYVREDGYVKSRPGSAAGHLICRS